MRITNFEPLKERIQIVEVIERYIDLCLKNSLILLKVFKKLFFVNFPIVFKTPTRFLLE